MVLVNDFGKRIGKLDFLEYFITGKRMLTDNGNRLQKNRITPLRLFVFPSTVHLSGLKRFTRRSYLKIPNYPVSLCLIL